MTILREKMGYLEKCATIYSRKGEEKVEVIFNRRENDRFRKGGEPRWLNRETSPNRGKRQKTYAHQIVKVGIESIRLARDKTTGTKI